MSKLLILHESPCVGGAEFYLFNVVKTAVQKGMTVQVLLCEPHCPVELDVTLESLGAEVIRANFGLSDPKLWRVFPKAWRLLKSLEFDIIFFNKRIDWYDFRHIILAAHVLSKSRLVAVEHWHPDGWVKYPRKQYSLNLNMRQAWLKLKCRIYTSFFDAIICMNNRARDVFISQYGYPSERLHVIYNGVDTKRFAFSQTARDVIRTELAMLDNTQLLVVAAGRLSKEKGFDVLLDAWSQLDDVIKQRAILYLAGEGPERECLEKQVINLGIQHQVKFIGQYENMPGLLSAADLFVAPSRRESFGLSIAEAMSVGCCVIATQAGGIPELLGDTGIYVEEESAYSLSEAINKVLADTTYREEATRLQCSRVREVFSLDKSMQNTLSLIKGRRD